MCKYTIVYILPLQSQVSLRSNAWRNFSSWAEFQPGWEKFELDRHGLKSKFKPKNLFACFFPLVFFFIWMAFAIQYWTMFSFHVGGKCTANYAIFYSSVLAVKSYILIFVSDFPFISTTTKFPLLFFKHFSS